MQLQEIEERIKGIEKDTSGLPKFNQACVLLNDVKNELVRRQNERIKLQARILELENLGPLIDNLKRSAIQYGMLADGTPEEAEKCDELTTLELQIEKILKGE